jgi:anti-sigma-K factor RskA
MPDTGHAFDHPEAAGYVLGSLDPDDRTLFEEHLRACKQCQAQVAEFGPVAASLAMAAPAVEPRRDLERQIVAAVNHAMLAESVPALPAAAAVATAKPMVRDRVKARPEDNPVTKARRWWRSRWAAPLSAALAGAAATAGAFAAAIFINSSPALAATISLHAHPGFTGSGMATAQATHGGFAISLTVVGLPIPERGQFYECWYAGPDNLPGHPQLITAGTFTVGGTGSYTFSMWSAANPAEFKTMQITLEQPGDASQHGKVILSGIAKT